MPLAEDARPKTMHRKSTCAGCRRRKSKCDGRAPKCTTCIAYKDDCLYDKPPSLAYVRSLEDEIHELKLQVRQMKTQAWLSKTTRIEQKKPPSPSSASDAVISDHSRRLYGHAHHPRHINWEADISLDDHGSISFHNSTSAVHESPLSGSHSPPSRHTLSNSHPSPFDDQQMKYDLMVNANNQRRIEHYVIANTAVRTNVTKETSMELLKYHWSWIHPLFLFVYRPAFIRSMAIFDYASQGTEEPSYFSETLLKVLHAHSSRFLNHDVYDHTNQASQQQTSRRTTCSAQDFRRRVADEARYGLAMDMLKLSSTPTIQALLQQSTREVTSGNASQAWIFAGAAFRMALDLGIHLPSEKLQAIDQSLTAEDVEVRKRLFWSCYTWDKILSLYLGRMPGFTPPTTDEMSLTFMDEYSETDLWAPYYGETPQRDNFDAPNYPPSPGYVISCFRQLCKLCIILNDLLQDTYSPKASADREDDEKTEINFSIEKSFIRIANYLQDWLICLPRHLRISRYQMPTLAPPVHILSLNLLYHTTVILLHRPVVLNTQDLGLPGPHKSYQICFQATAAIHDLLLLASNTFGLSHICYLNAYCAYTAATIAVLCFERDLTAGHDQLTSAKRTGLFFLLEVLDRSAISMPVLEKSSVIIRKHITMVLSRQSEKQSLFNIPVSSTSPYRVPATQETDSIAGKLQQIRQQNILPYSQSHLNGGFPSSEQWQSSIRNTLYLEPKSIMDEFPHGFPSQKFAAASENSYESDEMNPTQSGLFEYNFVPQPRVSAAGTNWPLLNSYEGGGSQIHST